jgi:ADP-ribosylglycohydrolase
MSGDRNRPEAEWTHVQDAETERARGALWGLFIGDALAMPAHWYYDRAALRRDYGEIHSYLAPKNPHPDSILWRSSYTPPSPEYDILHEQAQYWGRRGVHYHQFLQPGENTLNLKLAALLMESLAARGGYDADDYLARYIDFMRAPGRHTDTYVEECHRGFFANLAKGRSPRECGIEDIHIGGLAAAPILAVWYRDDEARALSAVREHVSLTHRAPAVIDAAEQLTRLLVSALNNVPAARIYEGAWIARARARGEDGRALFEEPDDRVIGEIFSPACYIEDAWPATLYLAAKYLEDPKTGLVANTMLGGDTCHRGAPLGALLGAANGEFGWPEPWREGLKEAGRLARLFQVVVAGEAEA